MIRLLLAFMALVCAAPALAGPLTADQRKRIEQAADVMPEDVIMYRWQSKASGEKLLAEQTFTDKLYDYFMGMVTDGAHFAAGRGIYAAENPHSSSQFVRGTDEGSLIEVRIAKGTRYLDMEDSKTLQRLAKLGISPQDVLNGEPEPRVAVKYNTESKWWVLKGQEGISFQPFDGSKLKALYLINTYSRLNGEKPKFIYASAVLKRTFALAKEDPDLLTKASMREMLGPRNLAALFDKLVDEAKSSEELARLRAIVKDSGVIRDHLARNPARAKTFRAREMEHFSLADRLKELGTSNPATLKKELRTWFETVDRPHLYARDLNSLADYARARPDLMIELVLDSALPASFPASGDDAAKIAAAKVRLIFTGEELQDFVRKGSDLFDRFKRAERALAYADRQQLGGTVATGLRDVQAELVNQVRKQLPEIQALPMKARLEKLSKVLPAISNPDELLKLLQTGGEFDVERSVARFVADNADQIFAGPLTPSQRLAFKNIAQYEYEALEKLVPKFIETAGDAEELVSLLMKSPDANRAHNDVLYWQAIAKHRDAIYARKPTVAQLLTIQSLRKGEANSAGLIVDFLRPALASARNMAEVRELLQDPLFKSWDSLNGAISSEIEVNWDQYGKRVSSLDDAKALLPFTMYEGRMRVTEVGMKHARDANELTKFLKEALERQGPHFEDLLATHLNIEFSSVAAKGISPVQWGEIMEQMTYGESRVHLYRKLFKKLTDPADFVAFAARASRRPNAAEVDRAVLEKLLPELFEKKPNGAQLKHLAKLYWPENPDAFLNRPQVAAYLKTAPKGGFDCGSFFSRLMSRF